MVGLRRLGPLRGSDKLGTAAMLQNFTPLQLIKVSCLSGCFLVNILPGSTIPRLQLLFPLSFKPSTQSLC